MPRIRSFFLADEKLGADRTENNTLGITFAWSGGTWFYVLGAFTWGPLILLVQPFWCVSLILLSFLFTRIHRATKDRTIHGFLDQSYGSGVRKVASIATTLGYIFNTGFEIYWSALLFAYILGLPQTALFIAIFIGLLAAIYCNIGGYKANATTDKPQNLIGVVALSILAMFVVVSSKSQVLIGAGIVFSIGSALYIVFSLLTNRVTSKQLPIFAKVVSGFAIALAIIAVLLSVYLSAGNNSGQLTKPFQPISSSFLIGMVSFMLVFNIVDMANWQSIAANGDIPEFKHKALRWSLIRSGLYVNWFPSLGGILVGLGLRLITDGATDKDIFQIAFSQISVGESEIIRGIIIGITILGFLATTLSTVDSYLMSAVQTVMYDIKYHDRIKKLLQTSDFDEEVRIVRTAKSYLIPMAMIMVFTFWSLYKLYDAATEGKRSALDFQMIIYSCAITLLVPVLWALFKGYERANRNSRSALVAISLGIFASIAPYIYVISFGSNSSEDFDLINYTPLYSLSITFITFFTGVLFTKKPL